MTNKTESYYFLLISVFVVVIMVKNIAMADPECTSLSEHIISKPLSLVELSDIALSCNPTTKVTWAQIKLSLANLGTNYSAYWPTIEGIYNYDSYKNTFKQSTDIDNGKRQITYGPEISLNYLIWDFGIRGNLIKAAEFGLQAAKFTQNATLQQVVLQVEQAYYQAIYKKALVLSAEDSIKENVVNLKAAKQLRKQGMATIGDVYQAESSLGQAQLILEQALGDLKITQGQLATAVGLKVQTPIILKDVSNTKTKLSLESIDELLNIAQENRPDLLSIKAQAQAADAQLTVAKLQNLPTLTLNASNLHNNSKNLKINELNHSIGFTVNIPIFSGFSKHYAILQAQGQKEQLEAQTNVLSGQIGLQVWQAYFALKTAAKSIDATEKILISNNQAAKQVYGQYKAGMGNILNVLTTQAALSNTRSQLIQAKLNWHVALSDLTAVLGNINIPYDIINTVEHKTE